MKWTKGTLKAYGNQIHLDDSNSSTKIAEIIPLKFFEDGESQAYAHLITTAVNVCFKINPENPQAVAESIGDMYEALERAYSHLCNGEFGNSPYVRAIRQEVEQAITKAKGK